MDRLGSQILPSPFSVVCAYHLSCCNVLVFDFVVKLLIVAAAPGNSPGRQNYILGLQFRPSISLGDETSSQHQLHTDFKLKTMV